LKRGKQDLPTKYAKKTKKINKNSRIKQVRTGSGSYRVFAR
jgi:hypothetical protein